MRKVVLMKRKFGVLVTEEKDGVWIYMVKPGSDQRLPIAVVKNGIVQGSTFFMKEGGA